MVFIWGLCRCIIFKLIYFHVSSRIQNSYCREHSIVLFFLFFFYIGIRCLVGSHLAPIVPFPLLSLRAQSPAQLPGVLGHDGISNGQGSHSLDDGDGAGHDAGVVAALGRERALAGGVVAGGGLVLGDGGGGLEGDAEEDGHAVGDAALDAAGVVGAGLELGARDAELGGLGLADGRGHEEGVVVDGALHGGAAEAGADLEGLDGGDAEHGVAEGGLELVEAGLAEAGGGVADDAGDGAARRVVGVAQLGDEGLHLLRGVRVRAADGQELVDAGARERVGEGEGEEGRVGGEGVGVALEEGDVTHRRHEGDDLDAVGLGQPLLRDGTGGHTSNSLAGRAPATARRGLDAVLLEVGPVGVRGTRVEVRRAAAVVAGPLVLVGDGQQGVPSVTPSSVPEWMVTWSFSSRGVVMADWPGRRRLSWGWMSDSVRARLGGQFSMMQDTDLPSPALECVCQLGVIGNEDGESFGTYVVTRKYCPKVDMAGELLLLLLLTNRLGGTMEELTMEERDEN